MSLCLIKHHIVKAYAGGSGGIDPFILNVQQRHWEHNFPHLSFLYDLATANDLSRTAL
jgi:hypothetical protein